MILSEASWWTNRVFLARPQPTNGRRPCKSQSASSRPYLGAYMMFSWPQHHTPCCAASSPAAPPAPELPSLLLSLAPAPCTPAQARLPAGNPALKMEHWLRTGLRSADEKCEAGGEQFDRLIHGAAEQQSDGKPLAQLTFERQQQRPQVRGPL